MDDNDDELGWSDPAVIVGAVALVALIVGIVIRSSPGTSRYAETAIPTSARLALSHMAHGHRGNRAPAA